MALTILLLCFLSGQPRRHLLTTGWSVFVSSKRLVAGDAFIFLRYLQLHVIISSSFTILLYPFLLTFAYCLNDRGEDGELRVGVRRLMRQLCNMPSSVISSQCMQVGVLATACHAVNTGSPFSIFYKPRLLYFLLTFLAVILLINNILLDLKYYVFSFLNFRTSPSEFVLHVNKYLEGRNHNFSIGLRFRMRFEGDESPERRYLK